jgi:hypothetical protein
METVMPSGWAASCSRVLKLLSSRVLMVWDSLA